MVGKKGKGDDGYDKAMQSIVEKKVNVGKAQLMEIVTSNIKWTYFRPTLPFLFNTKSLSPVQFIISHSTSTMLSIIAQQSTSNKRKLWIIPYLALLHFNEISKVCCKWTMNINRELSDKITVLSVN